MEKFKDIEFDEFDIDEVIEQGLVKKETFYTYLKRMCKSLGLRIIFIDGVQLLIVGILMTVILFVLGYRISQENKISEFYGYMFLISPISYMAMSLYGVIKAKESNTIPIEMVCKYNVYQIATFRIFILSIVGALINIFIVGGISLYGKNIEFVRPAIISVTGIFLFSSILLIILTKAKMKITKFIFIVIWFLISFICTFENETLREIIFIKIPVWIHLFIGIISIIIYVKGLNELINIRRDKGDI